jgi:hypothetical protein
MMQMQSDCCVTCQASFQSAMGVGVVRCECLCVAGAAWFGADTADNILQNNLGKKEVQAFLNISIARTLVIVLYDMDSQPCR